MYLNINAINIDGKSFSLDETLYVDDVFNDISFPIHCGEHSATFTLNCKLSKISFLKLVGMFNIIMSEYPNGKVKHMANYGKQKTRKKNVNRIIKTLEKRRFNYDTRFK